MTSPGGTTRAALDVLMPTEGAEAGLGGLVAEALARAAETVAEARTRRPVNRSGRP
ncbi:MAG: hypothetical protein R3C69_07835 [Geminicoccaceae bacterium]